jgi:ABC-2 type transport system permease protein
VITRVPLIGVTVRGVLGRRRTWLMILLASLPVVVALIIRAGGGHPSAPTILDTLLIRTVMPLIALVFGTAALGSELEDGTAVYLMIKPLPRWRILLAKMAVGAGLTILLVFPATVATSLLTDGRNALSMSQTLGYALVVSAGGAAYACAFVTLSAFTGRALILGLCYVLLWEGVLSGLLEGTRFLSIRQASLGLAARVTGSNAVPPPLDATMSAAILAIVVVGAAILGSFRLSRFEIRGGD